MMEMKAGVGRFTDTWKEIENKEMKIENAKQQSNTRMERLMLLQN